MPYLHKDKAELAFAQDSSIQSYPETSWHKLLYLSGADLFIAQNPPVF